MSLGERLQEYVAACFTGLWVQSHEHDDALREITQLCRVQHWRLAIWDVENGLQIPGHDAGQATDAGGSDPDDQPSAPLAISCFTALTKRLRRSSWPSHQTPTSSTRSVSITPIMLALSARAVP